MLRQPRDINSQQSFKVLSLKPNGHRKNKGAHDRVPPDPAISGGVRLQSLPEHATAARSKRLGNR
jgi:hypothetical protein